MITLLSSLSSCFNWGGPRPSQAHCLGVLIALFSSVILLAVPASGFQPNTIQVGSLEIHPFFGSMLTYNNNITLSREKVGDVIFTQTPGVSLEWGRTYTTIQGPRLASPYGLPLELLLDLYLLRASQMGERDYLGRARPQPPPGKPMESALLSSLRFRKLAFSLEYQPMFINLLDNPEFNSIDHELTFTGDVRLPGGLYTRFDNFFLKSNAVNNFRDEVADFNILQRTRGVGYTTNQAALTLGYNFYADYLAFVTYSNYIVFLDNFDPSELLSGIDLPGIEDLELAGVSSESLGFVMHTLGAYVSRPIGGRTLLTLGYLIGWVNGNLQDFSLQGSIGGVVPVTVRLAEDPRDAVFHEVRFRVQRVLRTKAWAFGVAIPKTSLDATLAYQWRDFKGTEIQIEAFDTPILRVPVVLESFQDFFVDLRLNSQIRPRTVVMLAFSRYPKEEVAGSGNVSINYRFVGSVTQRIRQKWSVGALGIFRLRESTFEHAIEAKSHHYEAGANISYNLQSWLKASMIYQFLARDGDLDYNDFDAQRIRFRVFLYF
jgi:hypothetical protein